MAQKVGEVMTPQPVAMREDAPVAEAARAMRDQGIGDVIVLDDDHIAGIVTDRDITIRVVADDLDPRTTQLVDIYTPEVATLSPEASIDEAVGLMRSKAVRRLPVVEEGRLVGIVSIGDLARERDPESALAEISSAEPNL